MNRKTKRKRPEGSGRKARAGEPAATIGLRLVPSERARYEASAAVMGVTLSQWLRLAAEQMDPTQVPAPRSAATVELKIDGHAFTCKESHA